MASYVGNVFRTSARGSVLLLECWITFKEVFVCFLANVIVWDQRTSWAFSKPCFASRIKIMNLTEVSRVVRVHWMYFFNFQISVTETRRTLSVSRFPNLRRESGMVKLEKLFVWRSASAKPLKVPWNRRSWLLNHIWSLKSLNSAKKFTKHFFQQLCLANEKRTCLGFQSGNCGF